MSELMQPLRDEHHEPLPSIDALRATADAIGAVPLPELRRHIAEATSSTPTTCCPTQPSKNRVRHAACSGLPFEEQVLMWWNFVARTREEILAAHADWTSAVDRFGHVASELPRIEVDPPPWSRL
jgi:hypothetical protein